MNTEKIIDDILFDLDKESIQERKNKNPLIPVLVILLGALLIILPQIVPPLQNFSNIVQILGGMVGIMGITLLLINFTKKGIPYYLKTNEKLNRHEFSFDQNQKDKVIKHINDGNLKSLRELPQSSFSPIKVIVYKTESDNMVLMQALEYIPHVYQPITEIKIIQY